MDIVVDDLSGPEIVAFLDEHVQQMRSVTPLESKHALDLGELRKPEVTFWSVLDSGSLVGCGAIKRLDVGHAELKSMRTALRRARSGSPRCSEHIVAEPGGLGFVRLSLETGSGAFFLPARRKLYEKFGFSYCGPLPGLWARSDPVRS
ncbi:GNAT family N-acetyltransferase [Streptomyces clavuligerus]|uniref:GNAT family N-acetyltransferase n=1 Tax=Streptomyces clavuligerus TaxID=1901 RepID=UPI000E54ABC4|nr:GNAT family N-acetyltransferase [Streptomyces clavuligerus]AXU11253.1 GNAT family N-acetyltransferase [Streptomyces clavuligerus]